MISTPLTTTTTRRTLCMLALAIMTTLSACSKGDRERPGQMTSFSTTGSKSGTPQLFTLPPDQMSHVQLVTVRPSTLTRTLRLTGTVAYNAFKTTPVITQVGGPVSRVLAVPGQQVRAGQAMLEISSPDYSQLLDAYLKAADSSRLADKNYARAKDLYEHHANAERDLEQAESDRNQAHADLNAAEQGMKILGIKNPADLATAPSSAQIQVLAPIGGEVVERLVSPGQVVQAGQTQAFTISDVSTVWVLANVYQADLASIHNGDDVVVTTDAYPGSFHGKISYVSPSLDATTRTLQARIVVDNPGEKLKKDMYVTVSVTAGSISRAIAVPDSSILRDDNNQPFVYVTVGDNQFGRRDVVIGPSQNSQTQILNGISVGERVVGDGSLFLQFANSLQH